MRQGKAGRALCNCCKPTNLLPSFLGITADEAYGGMGMGYQAHCVILEEISRASGTALPTPRAIHGGLILRVQVASGSRTRRTHSCA